MSEVASRFPQVDPPQVDPPQVDPRRSAPPRPDPPRVVEYPSSDGKPVAETDLHYDRLTDVVAMLKHRYDKRPDVYVGANMLVYYKRNNRKRHLAPDAFVVFGVKNHRRDVFLLWDETAPAFILEVTSKSTRKKDQHKKRKRYAKWGVREYFLYDPRADYLKPPLQGLTLVGDEYRDMPQRVLANGAPGLRSETLGLDLWLRDRELRLYDPVSGADLLTPREHAARGEAEAARADSLAEALALAQARLRELEARPRESKAQALG